MVKAIRTIQNVVIGAGVSGAVIFDRLSRSGFESVVLEKSKGMGGRIANRRIGAQSFSHGVQSFELDSPKQEVDFFRIFKSNDFESMGNQRFRILQPATQMIKHVLPESHVLKDAKVVTVNRDHDSFKWILSLDQGDQILCDHLFVTAPAPQALDLIQSFLPASFLLKMREVAYSKRIILFSEEPNPRMEFMDDQFSEMHFEKTDSKILEIEGSGFYSTVKKWRYEKVLRGLGLDFWSEQGLHLAGDYFNSRPNLGVSDSFRSSSALMNQLGFLKTSL